VLKLTDGRTSSRLEVIDVLFNIVSENSITKEFDTEVDVDREQRTGCILISPAVQSYLPVDDILLFCVP